MSCIRVIFGSGVEVFVVVGVVSVFVQVKHQSAALDFFVPTF